MDNRDQRAIADLYSAGDSIPTIARSLGLSRSTVRSRLLAAGAVIRSRTEGVRKAASEGRLGSGGRGKSRLLTASHKEAIRLAALRRGGKGVSLKPNGYLEVTMGKHKGRGQHRVILEQKLGRLLLPNEVAHHKNGDRSCNDPENLEAMTRSEHARLHALENHTKRRRNPDGSWS